jgi:hypothetical protein
MLTVHTSRVPRRKSLRGQLYRAARDLGNAQAAANGPGAYGKRVARRGAYRKGNSGIRKLLKGFGL